VAKVYDSVSSAKSFFSNCWFNLNKIPEKAYICSHNQKKMKNYKSIEIIDFAQQYGHVDLFNEDIAYLEELPLDYLMEDSAPIYVNAFFYFFVEEGEINITVNDKGYLLQSNDVVILSPSHLFKVHKMAPGTKYRLLLINELLYGQVTFSNRLYYAFLLYKNPVVRIEEEDAINILQCIDLVVKRLRAKEHYFQKGAIQLAMFSFLLELSNVVRHKKAQMTSSVSKTDNTFKTFAELVMKHYKTEHTISFYAGELNMSPQNLSLIVKGITGNTASDFIYQRLYHEARILLHRPELSIQQIADELHFSDQSAFGKFFKNKSGESPIQFRHKHLLYT
jgi:AraC-like DNA-binding protein